MSGSTKSNTNSRKKKRKRKSSVGKVILTILLIGFLTALICGVTFAVYVTTTIDPELDIGVETMRLNYTSQVVYLDESGNEHELEDLFSTQNRTWADLDEMPVHLKNAAIAIEDERFEKHHGVDWYRTFGAAVNMFFKMKSDFGASTITQQLVKNLTGDKQDTVKRKIQEIMRALYIERHYTKDNIIELYLNTIYLSEGCYGVRTAAEVYFDKDVSELTLAECASLIGITNLPTYYDPFINPENNKKRQVDILNKMLELEMISQQEYDEAINQELVFKHEKRAELITNKQSYFVDQVIDDVIDDLMEEHGYSYQIAEKMIYSGGLKIYATINPNIQNIMDSVFKDDSNFPVYKGSVQPECAMVVMDPYTGNVLGIVGGRGEKTLNRGLNRATQSYRQPGSALKPVSVYAPAIEYGLINPQSPEDDAPIKLLNNSPYPKNETRVYSGRMNITQGLEDSLNTVAMRTLEKLTPERSFNFLTANLGFGNLDRENDINLAPLSLGALTNGVSVLEMAAAYSAFPNQGTYIEPRTYTKVLDNQGNVILENTPNVIDAMSERTAAYMNYMLQKVVTEGTGVYAQLDNMPAAAKTGTTDGDKDRWFVGYTPYYTAAVWFGYDKPRYIEQSLSPALTVWKKVMNQIHTGYQRKEFFEAEDFQYVNVCSCSGLLPTDACSHDPRGSRIIRGYFYKDDVPTKRCNVHEAVQIDTTTMQVATEFCPPEAVTTYGLLNLDREYPSGAVVGDEKYTVGAYGTCTMHTTAAPPEEADPNNPDGTVPPDGAENPDENADEQPDGENPPEGQEPGDSTDSQSEQENSDQAETSDNTGDMATLPTQPSENQGSASPPGESGHDSATTQ